MYRSFLRHFAQVDTLLAKIYSYTTTLVQSIFGINEFRLVFNNPGHAILPANFLVGNREQEEISTQALAVSLSLSRKV